MQTARRGNSFCMAAMLLLWGAQLPSSAQQFRISDYSNETIRIEYPPCFDGAFLFIEQTTNLAEQAWEMVDYTQVELVAGDAMVFSPTSQTGAVTAPSADAAAAVPYIVTEEYLEALSNGEIENDEWTASTIWHSIQDGASKMFRITGISFRDDDNDGIDNLTEYADGSDPYANDAPPISLPPDDGDPRPVPGSVESAPGDWNTPPLNAYRATGSPFEEINQRILALDGTNGTFTAQTPIATLGAWIEAQCGTWQAVSGVDLYPKVSGGRFFRTPDEAFSWSGKEHVFALALRAYNGSESFVNHLVQAIPSDPAGLARLPDGSPVLVDGSNPWTAEKLKACLEQLKTVKCRLRRLSGAAFDPADTTAMAQSLQQWKSETVQRDLLPTDTLWPVLKIARWDWEYSGYQWLLQSSSTWYSRAQEFTFLDNLQGHGFGPTVHRGYVNIRPETDWTYNGSKYTWQTAMPAAIFPGAISEVFVRTDGETCWFMADDFNYADTPNQYGGYTYGYGTYLTHKVGYEASEQFVLSTLDPIGTPTQTLVMDSERDGTIDTNDWNRVDASHPYRFWVNEDGNVASYPEADMEDFFPAVFKATGPNQTFKLSSNVDLDYIPTTMTASDAQQYLHDIDLAQTLSGNIESLGAGTQTTRIFSDGELLLLAASAANTNAELCVHLLEGGSEVAVSTNHFSFTPVEEMYRIMNLRSGGASSTNEPANWPDDLTNGKDFVFVHGYNVTESAGRDWNNTIFKRLWHSGSNARFHALLWDGTPPTAGIPNFGYHYHNAVINAFATAPEFANYLNDLNEPVIMAHSLGNMLTSEAITGDHGLPAYKVKQYYALDAAVALEAYGDSSPTNALIPQTRLARNAEGLLKFTGYKWADYPYQMHPYSWYRRFDETDARSKLTWRHRFADVQDKTDVFNFYASTEDVLRVGDGYTIHLDSVHIGIDTFLFIPTDIDMQKGLYAWHIQEIYKGRSGFFEGLIPSFMGGGSSKYGGWEFVKESDNYIRSFLGLNLWPVHPRIWEERLDPANPDRDNWLDVVRDDPLFQHTPEELFSTGAEAFANGNLGTHGANLDYNTANSTVPVSEVNIRDWLLAKAFPAVTRPMGSTRNSKWPITTANFDMSDPDVNKTFMTDPGKWYFKDNPYNGQYVWRHSDIKDAPYTHINKLFEKITGKGN